MTAVNILNSVEVAVRIRYRQQYGSVGCLRVSASTPDTCRVIQYPRIFLQGNYGKESSVR